MKTSIVSLLSLVLLAALNVANAYPVTLQAHNQRSNSGTLSTLKWKTCAPVATLNPCLSTTNAWTLANATGSTAVWDWNPATLILSSTGTFQTTSFLSSNANGSSVISDKMVSLAINLGTSTSTATSYNCIEGAFLIAVGANGCLNVSTGFNVVVESSALYNLGGNANCVLRIIGGDDQSTGNPRGIQTAAAAGGCDAVDGGFNLYTLLQDTTATNGGILRISNGICIGSGSPDPACAGTNYLTFVRAPDAVDDGPIQASPGVLVSIDVLANDTAFTDPVTVAVTTAPTKGTATVVGSPGNQSAIRINYTADAGATGADRFGYTVTDADGFSAATATVRLNLDDATPNFFAFGTQVSVPLSTVVTSGAVTISGISIMAPVSIANGEFSVGCTAAYQSTPGSISNGLSICVRHMSAATPTTNTVTTLAVGGVTGTFTSTTRLGDPDADLDGIPDAVDNCTLVANAQTGDVPGTSIPLYQLDSDHDGYGNLCDADLNNSGLVTTADFAMLRSVLNELASYNALSAAADMNGSGTVTATDFAILRARLNTRPGPSGLHP